MYRTRRRFCDGLKRWDFDAASNGARECADTELRTSVSMGRRSTAFSQIYAPEVASLHPDGYPYIQTLLLGGAGFIAILLVPCSLNDARRFSALMNALGWSCQWRRGFMWCGVWWPSLKQSGCSIGEVISALRDEDETTRETELTPTSIGVILERFEPGVSSSTNASCLRFSTIIEMDIWTSGMMSVHGVARKWQRAS